MATAKRTFGKPFDTKRLNRGAAWKLDVARKQKQLADAVCETRITLCCCPICGEPRSRPFVEVYGYLYTECAACGHLYLQKPPSQDAVRRLYTSKAGQQKSVQSDIYAVRGLSDVRMQVIAMPKVKFVMQALGCMGQWVDIGSGTGELVVAAAKAGWEAVGYEIDRDEVEFAKSIGAHVELVEITPENATERLGDANVVSMLNMVEHLPDPVGFLAMISEGLPLGGYVAVEVPRHPSLSSFAVQCYPNISHRHIYPPDHLHVFSEVSLDLLLSRCGLEVEHVWLFGQDYYELTLCMACSSGPGDQELPAIVLDHVDNLQRAVDEEGLSDTMFVIARKDRMTDFRSMKGHLCDPRQCGAEVEGKGGVQ